MIRGMVISVRVLSLDAPMFRAASSRDSCTCRKTAVEDLTEYGSLRIAYEITRIYQIEVNRKLPMIGLEKR
jgi:hypothetical protein